MNVNVNFLKLLKNVECMFKDEFFHMVFYERLKTDIKMHQAKDVQSQLMFTIEKWSLAIV